jgi:hypothetical protein
MSCISNGSIFGDGAFEEADLVAIDLILTERATDLKRTRKGRVWYYRRGDVYLDVRVEKVADVLFDCEDDLVDLELLPKPEQERLLISAPRCGDAEDAEIAELLRRIANEVGGRSIGPRRSH